MQDISKIDKNFKIESTVDKPDIVWYDVSEPPFEVYGAYSKNPYLRMPVEVAERVNTGVAANNRYTAGVRARFKCNSPYIALHVEWDAKLSFAHMTAIGTSGFDLYSVADGKYNFVKPFAPPIKSKQIGTGYEGVIATPAKMTDYVLNFPSYNDVRRVFIGVKEGTVFEPAGRYRDIPPMVYYGSSITQGGCSSRPGTTYQSILVRALNVDYINLGFSGSGRGEREIAEYMASLDMSVFVSDYDHNSSLEELRQNHYALYEAVRAKHPDIPYVMISRPDFRENNEEDIARRREIMDNCEKARAAGDENVYFIDGASFFAEDEFWEHTVDRLHPNDLGFYKMAKKMLPTLSRVINEKYPEV